MKSVVPSVRRMSTSPDRGRAAAAVPERVARAAEAHRFGQLVVVRGAQRRSRWAGVVVGPLITLAALAALGLVAWLLTGEQLLGDGVVMHYVARIVACLAFAVVGLITTVQALLDPAEVTSPCRPAARQGTRRFVAYAVQVGDGSSFDIGLRPEGSRTGSSTRSSSRREHGRPVE
jgi:hypothetical protein